MVTQIIAWSAGALWAVLATLWEMRTERLDRSAEEFVVMVRAVREATIVPFVVSRGLVPKPITTQINDKEPNAS